MHCSNNTPIYTLQDYIKIKEMNNPYNLPKEAIDIIQYVSNMVGSPNYVKTPQFLINNENERKKKKRNKNNEINSEDWEAIRNFQATAKHEKSGIDKTIDNIKGEIHKIADKNYTSQKDIIMKILGEVVLNSSDDDINKVGNIIINISSSNRFFSKLYSGLVVEIINTYDFIVPIINNHYLEFETSIMEFISSGNHVNKDYDILCKINKENENRRSKALFFVNLMKEKCIEMSSIIDITNVILNRLYDNIDNSECVEVNEELSELLFVIINESYHLFKDNDKWCDIHLKITNISDMKNNDKGLTNKIIFKLMDLLDIINTT